MSTTLRHQPRYAVGLYRVSTAEQGHSGLGLEAQQAAVRAFVAAQGGTLVAEYSDIASGKDDRRPGFLAALARCRQLGAVLVAARLDHITRRADTERDRLQSRCVCLDGAPGPRPDSCERRDLKTLQDQGAFSKSGSCPQSGHGRSGMQ